MKGEDAPGSLGDDGVVAGGSPTVTQILNQGRQEDGDSGHVARESAHPSDSGIRSEMAEHDGQPLNWAIRANRRSFQFHARIVGRQADLPEPRTPAAWSMYPCPRDRDAYVAGYKEGERARRVLTSPLGL